MRKIRLGFIGCGDVAQRDYLPEFHRLAKRAELTAVCGLTEARVKSVAQQYGFQTWYTDYRQLLSKSGVDAIINLTPIQMHTEINLAALLAGKHVYTEKPVASSVAEAQQMQTIAQQQGLKFVCAPCVMLFPQVKYAQTLIRRDNIGAIYSARGQANFGVPPWAGFMSDPTPFFVKGAGPAVDMGVYPLHALTGLLGPAKRITAITTQVLSDFTIVDGPFTDKKIPVEVDDNWHLILDFGDSRLVSMTAQGCIQGTKTPHVELHGLQGTIALNVIDVSAPIDLLRAGSGWEQINVPQTGRAVGPDHHLGIEHLVDCIQHDREPVLNVSHALHVLEIIEKAAQSSTQGRTLTLETTF
ncbi:MAG: Gfo/Idh/MocA family oxidoreductase [Chloroflexota bacterium]